ncbi:MAG: ATP-dependent helicase HrpB, partial [Myxococcota bacterium]
MQPLPIDSEIPGIVEYFKRSRALVIEAPPGAGKTTRVPWALLESGAVQGSIVVVQPRRLPARLSAHRVAAEHGQKAGMTVGYTVRFEDVTSSATRIRYVTEGILTR